MNNLRNVVTEHRADFCGGIAWLAFWRESRSWYGESFYLDEDDYLCSADKIRLIELQATDPKAVVVNGWDFDFYSPFLDDEISIDELTAGIQNYYKNGLSNIAQFIEKHDDMMPLETLEKIRERADKVGLPFYENYYHTESFEPNVYDGNMNFENFEMMHRIMEQSKEKSTQEKTWEGNRDEWKCGDECLYISDK